MKTRKYTYYKVLQEWTGYGWEDSCQYDIHEKGWRKEWIDDKKAYRGEGVPIRSIERRVLNQQ